PGQRPGDVPVGGGGADPAHPLPPGLPGAAQPARGRGRVPGHPPAQPAGPRLLVRARQDALRLDRPARLEARRALSPQRLPGPGAKTTPGRGPRELAKAALERESADVHTTGAVMQAAALRLLGQGDAGGAAAVLGEGDRRVEAKGLRQESVAPVLSWLAPAL